MRPLLSLTALLVSLPAWGEPAMVQSNRYIPSQGHPEICTLEFETRLATTQQETLTVEGSVNSAFFKGKAPVLMIKVFASKDQGGKQIPIKLKSASMQTGDLNTNALKQVVGESGTSVLMLGDALNHRELVLQFAARFLDGASVAVTFESASEPVTYQLPAVAAADDIRQKQASCHLRALETLRKGG